MEIESVQTQVARFAQVYQALSKDNLASLETIYHPDIVFIDPAHRIEGLSAFLAYFASLYQNVTSCQFDIHHTTAGDNDAFVTWTMTFSHPRVQQGRPRQVHGCSHLTFTDGRISRHRDYFDMGEMIYEALPLMGRLLTYIKARLGQ